MNSTPWCNLFSTASKFNIQVNESRNKLLVIYGLTVFFLLLLVLYFSYAYFLALVVATLTLLVLGVLYSQQRTKHRQKDAKCLYQFELNQQGLCLFNGNEYYQLHASSRFSFFGCWLMLLPTTENKCSGDKAKQLFIFRDSLTEQDFSRLSQVLRNLTKVSYPQQS
ncbi:MAG: hypothetical protein OQK09_04810 [Colwellia sp.]|nr:hypothetical protein [Colwellia sp.]MCW8864397.1 hypothetical protein [Colwellia sp.]MCW9080810.1 hypothetical protein [Colwellia sp.]